MFDRRRRSRHRKRLEHPGLRASPGLFGSSPEQRTVLSIISAHDRSLPTSTRARSKALQARRCRRCCHPRRRDPPRQLPRSCCHRCRRRLGCRCHRSRVAATVAADAAAADAGAAAAPWNRRRLTPPPAREPAVPALPPAPPTPRLPLPPPPPPWPATPAYPPRRPRRSRRIVRRRRSIQRSNPTGTRARRCRCRWGTRAALGAHRHDVAGLEPPQGAARQRAKSTASAASQSEARPSPRGAQFLTSVTSSKQTSVK